MSMVNPYEGLPSAAPKPNGYWVAEVSYPHEPGYVIGVYSSEEQAMVGAVKFIQHHGWPAITDFRFSTFELNATNSRIGVAVPPS